LSLYSFLGDFPLIFSEDLYGVFSRGFQWEYEENLCKGKMDQTKRFLPWSLREKEEES